MRLYVNGERVKRFHGSDARIYVHGERTKMCIVQSYTRASVQQRQRKVSVVAVRGKTLEALREEKRWNNVRIG